jgi:hypothetical protein
LFSSHELDTITDLTSCPHSKRGNVLADFLQVVVYLFVCTTKISLFLKLSFELNMQDIPASGILADDILFDERSAILLLAFLYSHLTNEKRLVIFVSSPSKFPALCVLFRMHETSCLIYIGSTKELDQYKVSLPKPGQEDFHQT